MTESRRSSWRRTVLGGLAAGLIVLIAGDSGGQVPSPLPIDPLDILAAEVKPNVLILFDTSRSMKWDVDTDGFPVGGDDPRSRFKIAKDALNTVLPEFSGKASFGFATFNAPAAIMRLNPDQNRDGGPGGGTTDGLDGPLVYVSDPSFDSTGNAQTWLGFFNGASNTFTSYDGPTSGDIFRSFMNDGPYAQSYPAGCTPGVSCRVYLQSRLLRGGTKFQWDRTVVPASSGLVAEVADASLGASCIAFEDSPGGVPNGLIAKFCYSSGIFDTLSPTCKGVLVEAVPGCAAASNVAQIQTHLRPELDDADGDGVPDNVSTTGPNLTNGDDVATPVVGIRADEDTPPDLALADAGTFVPSPGAFQKSFILLITDGLTDDDLVENGRCGADPNAKIASATTVAATLFAADKETIVVAFGGTVNKNRADQIAQAGSVAGSFGRDAFVAHDASELEKAIRSALDVATNSGTFSVTQPIIATVFELATDLNNPSNADVPLDPKIRYNNRVNILYSAQFDLPGWNGHLFAFRNDGTFLPVGDVNVTGRWDAGESLLELVSQKSLEATDRGRGPNRFTFFELHQGRTVWKGASGSGIGDKGCAPKPGGTPSGCALVQRRIFTSSPTPPGGCQLTTGGTLGMNCTYTRPTGDGDEWNSGKARSSNVVALWPPNQAGLSTASGISDIDPPAASGLGPLDAALGIGTMSFSQLKSDFGACDGSADAANSGPIPTACDVAVDPTLATNTARKEARQVILAFTAGAQLARAGFDGRPVRDLTTGELLYRDRGWLLRDSTMSTPAIAAPPLRSTPNFHTKEFVVFRDGRRGADRQGVDELDKGFGLRNPDFDDSSPASKKDLKPVMTILYTGANDMLHAFRAGPSCGKNEPTLCTADGEEQGSEELWGFVPFDQLGKLKDFVTQGQVGGSDTSLRDIHKYMIASSIRLVDVFIPSPYTDVNGIGFEGRWRTIILFGRGPGGKFYTALDVTAPGPFTRRSLQTNPPFVLWNHGNEDSVNDGAYEDMGQSWSVPAVGNVDTTIDGLPEWRAWVGSGYGNFGTTEGKRFFMLDAVTGDVVRSYPVTNGGTTHFEDNALVASAAAFNAFFLDNPTQVNRSEDRVSRVYIPDIKGRVWKFNTTSGGAVADKTENQPFGNAVALLKFDAGGGANPFVFAEAGNDNRVPLSAGPFRLFGFEDTTAEVDIATPLTQRFFQDFVDSSGNRYRGHVQPATAFNEAGNGRVFFAGFRQFASPSVSCADQFDTILFALTAVNGSAAYDFNGGGADLSAIVAANRATSVGTAGGQLVLGESGGAGMPPPTPEPPPSSLSAPAPPKPPAITIREVRPGTAVCRIQ